MNPLRILIADDQELFRTGIRDLLASADGIDVVAEASDGLEAVALAQKLQPDLVLMDIRMPQMDGIEATRRIRAHAGHARVIVLTTFDDEHLVSDAVTAGAVGYLLKGTPLDEMLGVLALAARGYTAFAPGVLPSSRTRFAPPDSTELNERQREVWALMGRGFTNRDIAERLALTEGTVKNYVTEILRILGARHRTEAAILWQLHGRRA